MSTSEAKQIPIEVTVLNTAKGLIYSMPTKKACVFTGLSPNELRKQVPFMKRGKNLYFRVLDLINYMEHGASIKSDSITKEINN